MQTSLHVQHCMFAAGISCVCLYGNHCMLNVHTWRAALVSIAVHVCHDCRSLHAAQASWYQSQSMGALTSIAAFLA